MVVTEVEGKDVGRPLYKFMPTTMGGLQKNMSLSSLLIHSNRVSLDRIGVRGKKIYLKESPDYTLFLFLFTLPLSHFGCHKTMKL